MAYRYSTLEGKGLAVIDMPETTNETTTESSKPLPKKLTKSAVHEAAERLRAESMLPPKPGKVVDHDSMVAWLNLLTEPMRKHIIIYVYRHFPIIDRKQVNPNADVYIDCMVDIPTREYMSTVHGGGKYGFKVNDTDAQVTLFDARLEIPITEVEPKYDLMETVWTERNNTGWISKLRAEGKIDINNKIVSNPVPSSNNPSSTLTDAMIVADKITSAYRDSMTAQVEALRQAQGGRDNNNTTKMLSDIMIASMQHNDPAKLLGMIQAAMPKQQDSSNVFVAIMPLFVEMMKNSQQQAQMQMQLMLNMMEKTQSKVEPMKNPLAFLEQAFDFLQRRMPSTPTSEETTTDKILGVVERVGAPLAESIINAVALKNAGLPPGQAPIPKTLNVPTLVPKPATPTIDPLVTALRQFSQWIVDGMNDPDSNGMLFGQWLETKIGSNSFGQICNYGTDVLYKSIASIPEIYNSIKAPDRDAFLKEWVNDFVNCKEEPR